MDDTYQTTNRYEQFAKPQATTPGTQQQSTSANRYEQFAQPSSSDSSEVPAQESHSLGHELLVQPIEGLYQGIDNTYNLPNYLVNAGAKALGYEPPITPAKLFTRASTGEQPTTTGGRYARAIGEQAGAMAVPYVGMVGRGMAPATTMLGRAVSLPATGESAAQNMASAVGAGIAGQTAEENKEALGKYAPYVKTAAEIAGGFGGPTVYNVGAKIAAIPKNFAGYAARVGNEAMHPQMAADRDAIDSMRRAGTDPVELRDAYLPQFPNGSNLQARGFTREHLAEIVGRRMEGESAGDIAADFTARGLSIHRSTVDDYVQRYQADNPTQMTPMDTAEELGRARGAPGASIPMVRQARAAQTIAREIGPGNALLARQENQGPRMTAMVNRALPQTATAAELRNLDRSIQQQAVDVINNEYPAQGYERGMQTLRQQAKARQDADYTTLHSQPPVVVDEELASILANPEGAQAYKTAMGIARSERQPIPTREELLKSFGLRDKEGFGLNQEGSSGAGLAAEARYNLQQRALAAKAQKARDTGDSDLADELEQLQEGLKRQWETKSTGKYPSNGGAEPGALFTPKTLDYYQRALRKASKNPGDPNSEAFFNLRRRLIEHLDPETPTPDRPTLIQGLRQTMGRYRTDMGAEEAVELAAKLKPKLNENTYDALAQFEQMTHPQQELFRLRYARNMQDAIKNQAYGKDTLAQFDSPAHHEIIRRIYPADTADRMINGLASTRLTQQAHDLGSTLASRAASEEVGASEELRAFRDDMNPQQQALFRAGFAQQMRNMIGKKVPGKDVETQFHTPNTQAVIREVLPARDAERLIRDFNREHIGTGTKQGLFGNSTTSQQIHDIQDIQESSRAVTHAAMGWYGRTLDDFRNALLRKVGEQRSSLLLRQLGELNPMTNIQNFDRQITQMTRDARLGLPERQLLSVFRQKVRNYFAGRAWMAGEATHALARAGSSDHAQRLSDIENSNALPEQKRDLRRRIFEEALKTP